MIDEIGNILIVVLFYFRSKVRVLKWIIIIKSVFVMEIEFICFFDLSRVI